MGQFCLGTNLEKCKGGCSYKDDYSGDVALSQITLDIRRFFLPAAL